MTDPTRHLLLVEDESRKAEIVERFGGGPLAERVGEELLGIAHLIKGVYKPRI